jgi:hypothetical protein
MNPMLLPCVVIAIVLAVFVTLTIFTLKYASNAAEKARRDRQKARARRLADNLRRDAEAAKTAMLSEAAKATISEATRRTSGRRR